MNACSRRLKIDLGIVEVRCPRCNSSCASSDKKKHEYSCNHCGTTFRFAGTTTCMQEVFKKKVGYKETKRKAKTGQSYRCYRVLNSRIPWCGKRKADKSCLEANIVTGGICSDLLINRKWKINPLSGK